MREGRRRRGGISLALVVTMVTIVFLGLSATSFFRRSVTRQLASLLYSLQIVDIAEAAINEVAQREKLDEYFRQPGKVDALAQAFKNGNYQGGVLFPPGAAPGDTRAPVFLEIEPTAVKARFQDDERIRVGDVKMIPLQYRPTKARQVGLLRFVVGVSLEDGPRTFAKKVGADYEYSVFKDPATNELRFLLSLAPKAKVYP